MLRDGRITMTPDVRSRAFHLQHLEKKLLHKPVARDTTTWNNVTNFAGTFSGEIDVTVSSSHVTLYYDLKWCKLILWLNLVKKIRNKVRLFTLRNDCWKSSQQNTSNRSLNTALQESTKKIAYGNSFLANENGFFIRIQQLEVQSLQ